MKKGSFVLVEHNNGTSVMGTVVEHDEDANTISLKEVGSTQESGDALISRRKVAQFIIFPKKVVVQINLWNMNLMFEWPGKPPKGWKRAVALAEESACDCGKDDEDDEDEDEDEDEENDDE